MGRESDSRLHDDGDHVPSLFELFTFVVLVRWKHLCLVAAVAFVLGYFATFLITPVYEAEIVLLVSLDDSAPSGLSGDLGSLGALTGISLQGSSQRQQEAVALLTSNDVAIQFVNDHSLLPELFPVRWKLNGGSWGDDGPPSEREVADAFHEAMLHVRVEQDSGMIFVSSAAPTPEATVSRVRSYVQLVDSRLRERTISESADTLEVLGGELRSATTVELRAAISNLMVSTIREKTFASIKREYAYKIIDRPLLPGPGEPARPKRLFTAIASVLSFTSFAVFIFAWTHRRRLLRQA